MISTYQPCVILKIHLTNHISSSNECSAQSLMTHSKKKKKTTLLRNIPRYNIKHNEFSIIIIACNAKSEFRIPFQNSFRGCVILPDPTNYYENRQRINHFALLSLLFKSFIIFLVLIRDDKTPARSKHTSLTSTEYFSHQ
jgi:hypothetical protein